MLAARHALVTVEEVVDELTPVPGEVVLPRFTVDAVAVVPGGAAPSYAHGYYDRDNAAYLEWEKISRDRETFTAWLRRDREGRTGRGAGGTVNHTAEEMMTVAAARELRDGQVVFVGIDLPSRAANLARRLHAPGLVLVYESGRSTPGPTSCRSRSATACSPRPRCRSSACPRSSTTGCRPGGWTSGSCPGPRSTATPTSTPRSSASTTSRTCGCPAPGARPRSPRGCREVIVVMRHRKRAFVDRVDFVTTCGYGTGPTDRALLGLRGAGPVRVITDLGVLEPEPESKELMLTALHPGVTVEQVRAETGWSLEIFDELGETTPPTERELTTLRAMRTVGAAGVR